MSVSMMVIITPRMTQYIWHNLGTKPFSSMPQYIWHNLGTKLFSTMPQYIWPNLCTKLFSTMPQYIWQNLGTKPFSMIPQYIWFGLDSLFNGISTLFRLFNAKAILLEEQEWYYLTHSWWDKGVHTFPKGICPKVNTNCVTGVWTCVLRFRSPSL